MKKKINFNSEEYDYFKLHESIRTAFIERDLHTAADLINLIQNEDEQTYSFDMSMANIDNPDAVAVLGGLQGKTSIEMLVLEGNDINDIDALNNFKFLSGTYINRLLLGGNNINCADQIQALGNAVQNSPLTTIMLNNNNIKDGAAISALSVFVSTKLIKLDFAGNKINTIDAISQLNSLAGSSISMLLFSKNQNNTPEQIAAFSSLGDLVPNNVTVEVGCDQTGNQDNIQAIIDLQTTCPNINVLEFPMNKKENV